MSLGMSLMVSFVLSFFGEMRSGTELSQLLGVFLPALYAIWNILCELFSSGQHETSSISIWSTCVRLLSYYQNVSG